MSNTHDHDREFDSAIYDKEYFEGDGHKSGYTSYQQAEGILVDQYNMISTIMRPRLAKSTVLDLGCAYGFGLKQLGVLGWEQLEGADVSEWAISQAVKQVDGGIFYCTDVARDMLFWKPYMQAKTKLGLITGIEFFEHVESKDVPQLVYNMSQSAEWGFFVINGRTAPYQDVMGNHGDHGHLNNHNMSWWIEQFAAFGEIDFDAMYMFSREAERLYPELHWHNRAIVVKFNNKKVEE